MDRKCFKIIQNNVHRKCNYVHAADGREVDVGDGRHLGVEVCTPERIPTFFMSLMDTELTLSPNFLPQIGHF